MKKYLHCTITNNNGTTFTNPLKLSEVHLISQIAQENQKIIIRLETCTKEQYKAIFG